MRGLLARVDLVFGAEALRGQTVGQLLLVVVLVVLRARYTSTLIMLKIVILFQ